MLSRIREPEVMDTAEEAVDYNQMDHSNVNRRFVDDFLRALELRDPTEPRCVNVIWTERALGLAKWYRQCKTGGALVRNANTPLL